MSEASFESAGPIAFLTFNRPEARNALTWAMYDALVEACDRVDTDDTVRAFVVRSTGEAFAAGTDIRQFTGFASGADGIAYEKRLDAVIDRLERVSAVTIAQIHGVAAGGGCMIALACDLRVCTPAAQFGVPIARTLGNCLSAANLSRLVDLVGPACTRDLLLTGRLIDVKEAAAMGLVTRIAELPDVDAAVRQLAESIAANAPLTIRATKEVLGRLALKRRLEPEEAEDAIAACYASQDFRDAVAAFLAKRRPRFTGR
jgi:enoyl-CoA hydratase/carnithine racemase